MANHGFRNLLLLVASLGCTAGGAQFEKTADLSGLIRETLAINNKSIEQPAGDSLRRSPADSAARDEWTFDMVEYDLMEFLQDLGARYQSSANRSAADDFAQSQLAAKSDSPPATSEAPQTGAPQLERREDGGGEPEQRVSKATQRPLLSTSLAASLGEHEISESKWQYGIFDRFTRPKQSTTTPEPDILPLSLDDNGKIEARNFNSDECGLRTYDEQSRYYPESGLEEQQADAIKDLSQRRQKLPANLPPLVTKKQQQQQQLDLVDELDRTNEKLAYDSYKNSQLSGGDQLQPPGDQSAADAEYNLASRRQWLQQQLGNTLQLLGFNASSSQTISDYFNDTSGGLAKRENMMKMSGKLGKSLAETASSAGSAKTAPTALSAVAAAVKADDGDEKLIARQDELKLEARVIGGSDARLGDSPWSVSLQALVSRPGTGGIEYRHYCGGTIISEYYVLTAAHCLDFMVGRESRLFVVVGDLNWRMSAASLYGRRFGIDKLIIHSGYKSTAFGHDIGLIKVKESLRPVKVNGRYIVNSVCLPERNVEHTGEAELVGWGLFSNRNEMADSLQIADVPILPRPLCVDLYRRRTGLIQWLIGIELITEKQVCAGTFGRGICQGDSGSALVFNERQPARRAPAYDELVAGRRDARQRKRISGRTDETRATIIGIVAFGGIRRCSYQSLPGVYMQASKYMDWIVPRIQT